MAIFGGVRYTGTDSRAQQMSGLFTSSEELTKFMETDGISLKQWVHDVGTLIQYVVSCALIL